MARRVANHFRTPRRKSTSPVRTLIDATFPALNSKQKSRWSRALEFAALTKRRQNSYQTFSGTTPELLGAPVGLLSRNLREKRIGMTGPQILTCDDIVLRSSPIAPALLETSITFDERRNGANLKPGRK